jgi:hypothetical protein
LIASLHIIEVFMRRLATATTAILTVQKQAIRNEF